MTYHDCDNDCSPACPEYPCEALSDAPAAFWVYVAGRLSGHPGQYLANVHELSATSRRLMEEGYCPVNPAGDLLEGLMRGEALPVPAYQARSLQLLELLAAPAGEGRAALLLVEAFHPDGSPSAGVAREVEFCHRRGIPVVSSFEELHDLRRAVL